MKGTADKFLREAGRYIEITMFGQVIQEDFITNNNIGKQFYELNVLEMSSEKMLEFFLQYSENKLTLAEKTKIKIKSGKCWSSSINEELKLALEEIKNNQKEFEMIFKITENL